MAKNKKSKKIITAMNNFLKGSRPSNYRKPDWWYVLNTDGTPYPAKAIWAMATAAELRNFNTTDARHGLEDCGFPCIKLYGKNDGPEFDEEINRSMKLAHQQRKKRLATAPKTPAERLTVVRTFKRNPDVVVEVLKRANGKCEICSHPAPFTKKSNGTPYLEVHHEQQLADGGEDTIENAIAACPNCHRERHFG